MPQIQSNGLTLEYDSFGKARDPVILLIMGLGAQMIMWPEAFCRLLAEGGYRVIRFDNRDIGLSTKIEAAGKPRLLRAALSSVLRLPIRAPYLLDDMAQDVVGLMDALKINRAHLVGASMGGMIAQIVAAKHPPRVASLTSIMSSSGHPRLPGPSLRLKLRMVRRPQQLNREHLVRHAMQTLRLIGSPGYPLSELELRERAEANLARSMYPRGVARQTAALLASGSRTRLLPQIKAPVLIVHGTDDPLVPVAAAYDLADRIPDSRLMIVPGMGHDLPPALLPLIAARVLAHVGAAAAGHLRGATRRAK